jgi:hypothetical protein
MQRSEGAPVLSHPELKLEKNESASQLTTASNCKKKTNSSNRNWQGTWRKTPGRLLGVSLIRLYQLTLSGFVGHSCRHQPTCSEYGYEAIARYGLLTGSFLTAKRVAKCGPWGTSGFDPVPHQDRTVNE